MQITIDIPAERVSALFSSAIEGGDPVTTAARGGWCWGIYWQSHATAPPKGDWYAEATIFDNPDLLIEIIEVSDEGAFDAADLDSDEAIIDHNLRKTKAFTSHVVDAARIAAGLKAMAEKFGGSFTAVIADNIDAPCADIFLQCVLFGEEKYA